MKLSLKNRVQTSFWIANAAVLILTFTVFHFLETLNKDIQRITEKSNKLSILTEEVRISAISILKVQRKILVKRNSPVLVEKLQNQCDSFISQLNTLDSLYENPQIKTIVTQMLSYVDSLKLILGKASLFHRDTVGMSTIGDLADKILDSFSELQDIQYDLSIQRDKQIDKVIKETKRSMMITLIIGFLGTILLALVVPGKIALPFKKIKDAIRELQECNFDVSIYYSQDDEIGEIAREMNKMIHSIKIFDELRTDRISVERRKFDALANMVKKPVLVANADSKLIYMNNKLYSLLQVQSEDVIGKVMNDTVLPPSIISSYELAIKRRSKIENQEILIEEKKHEEDYIQELKGEGRSDDDEHDNEESEPGENNKEVSFIFKGYSTVIPIRGKDSSLDYYLMVLSEDVFV